MAAEIGTDWQKVKNLIFWDGVWRNNLPVLDKKYQGKNSLISSVKGKTRVITFCTKRHGGESRSWYRSSSSAPSLRVTSGNQMKAKKQQISDEIYRRKKNQEYIDSWKSCSKTVDNSFPYLQTKKLEDVGLTLMAEHKKNGKISRPFMAVPVFDQKNQIAGLQRIYEDGNKAFTPGTSISGSFYRIGPKVTDKNSKVYLCEGWATGQTIHRLTGCTVYCAFNAGNLLRIAEYLLTSFKRNQIILAADNDCWKKSQNTGLLKALEINYRYRIKVRYPSFDGLGLDGKKPTDFNDLYCLAGAEETLKQLCKSRKNTLSVPSNSFEYKLKAFLLAGHITSAKNKYLRACINAALYKGLSAEKITAKLLKTNQTADKSDILKALYRLTAAHSRRVAKCHTIDPKAHPGVTFIDLPTTRQEHGGYLIDPDFYDSIKDLDGIIIVKAPMGSGKTDTILRRAMDIAGKSVYLAHRIALVEECGRRINFESYRSAEQYDGLLVTRKLGCCINSLCNPKFDSGRWFLNSDVVCIDEGTKVFHHLTGSTVKNPEEVTEVFLKSICAARQVIVCDADANDTLVSLLSKHTDQKIYVAQANPVMDHVNVVMMSLEETYQYTIDMALKGEKVLCTCDSKKDVERLKKAIEDKNEKIKVLDIFSESKVRPEVEAWIKNPNEESLKWDVVIYNSCVDSGVSITTDHFRHQTGLFRGVVSPDAAIQMMGRNRPAKSWHLGCSPMNVNKHTVSAGDNLRTLTAATLRVQLDSGISLAELPQPSIYDQIRLDIHEADSRSRQSYLISLRMMMEQKGYRVIVKEPEKEMVKSVRKEMRHYGQQINDEFIDMVLAATTPLEMRYNQLKQAYAISKEELAEVIRYEICHKLGVREINKASVIFWMDDGYHQTLSFEIMQAEHDELHQYDAWQLKTVKSLTRRKNLTGKGRILRKLFKILGVDRQTGLGHFTHRECSEFVDYLMADKDRAGLWNYYSLGQHLHADRRPKDSTRFVQACLKKLGLTTSASLFGKERTSRHEIDAASWEVMTSYIKQRKDAGKHIADLSPEAKELLRHTDNAGEQPAEADGSFSYDNQDPDWDFWPKIEASSA